MKIDTSKHSHFSFDLWLTLIRSNPSFKAKRNALFKAVFNIGEPLEKVAAIVRHYDVLANKISEVSGRHMYAEQIYCLVLQALHIDLNEHTQQLLQTFQAEADELFMLYKPVLLHTNLQQHFEAIRAQGKSISILSNTAFIKGSVLRQVLAHYELSELLSFQLYSDEIGYAKPAGKAFDLVYQHANSIRPIDKSSILHIGDNPTADYHGAINFGFNALLI
ncbi:putative hydrolase of the HAD superfamily [Chitinophaga skermanii]|uniref:Putative hydrolase of the HAD superfamily n=1 Tax=Chitinophaga skermanii TaxID=331697 RepID=A0A327R312_9BACT|nr:HAD family hydrolase [Chitinophaga skermanii]RAJ08277.1 putative hydrolase of the HAD superfamily [Chitinophaga skermanii]